ncbi:MFS transporter [Nakamurella endophytica]|uniref:MFS transporter n=1 Tax=Nakamurella endophytica TaxID=1748367 RepID=A0A917T433_9ACTN|nr:MFS transporter [Nakamurella endophytica]GGM08567.1 MFS transporter [Nakamurella endophytica]
MSRALFALAVGAFGIGCTEFVMMGLLPQIGADLHVSVPAMGVVITAYAIGVVIGAPTTTLVATWLTTRQTLMTLMAVFVTGNLLVALAPSFQVLLAARVLTALAHGSFFGVGAIAARRAVAPHRATQAISLMFVGLTVANVVGVPAGTWVGQHLTWRLTFAAVAGIGLLTVLALRLLLPEDQVRIDVRAELGAFRRPRVWLGLAITTVGFGSLFAVYSYVTPILTELSGLGPTGVTVVLALFGAGTTVGTLVGGRFGDRWGMPVVAWGLAVVALLLVAFTVTSAAAVPAVVTLVAFGMVAFSLGPVVQNRIIVEAGTGGSLVSAANQGAFNVANAIGAGLGALVIEVGLGYRATMWVGAALAVAGAVMVAATLGYTGDRRRIAEPAAELVG